MIILSICLFLLSVLLYKRYVPVSGVSCEGWQKHDLRSINVVDLRDYNESFKNPINGAINIPIAYLNRFYKEIPNREIHVIVSSKLEKNMGIRFLRQKGFNVIGFSILDNNSLLYNKNFCCKRFVQ